ncbi:restriction endonuclease subunit S [Dokdonella soli]|uniref:Type I restriction modification DNA specificity domain-containing protein n=1 Tax=Dokdonella soli TaxID=529810 RepID=A0ABN1IXE3_9GAMM
MSNIPQSWVAAPIGDLCTLNNGRAFKPSEWKVAGVPIVRIQNLNNPVAKFNRYEGEVDGRYRLRGGELLFAWSGTPGTSFGAHIWKGGEAVVNQHIFRVDFDETLLSKRFFQLAINQKLGELIDIAHGGVGLRHVTKGKFERTEIALPPQAEQQRIADKLDALLARVDACRERLGRIPNILKRFRQSVLAAATSQSSTFEAGGKSPWRKHLLADLCVENRVITYGVIKLGDEVPEGVPCLRTSNVRKLLIEAKGLKRIASSLSKEYDRTVLQGGEVLVNVRGTLGGVAVVPNQMTGWNVSREVAVVPVDQSRVSPEFLAFWIATDEVQRWLTGVQKGVAYTGINIEDLRNLPVELPTLDEQTEIVRRVDALFALADRIEARYEATRAQVDKLTPALLAKAFRGELVPQDPADEPASVLLDRIRASRDGAPTKPRRGRSARARKKTA